MEPLGCLNILYYGNRHMKDLYSIHALFHGKAVTTEPSSYSLKANSRLSSYATSSGVCEGKW